ncbi:ParA family protein [uncultured Chryseobacterium sp.]|uniref:ParA family protein n=1 Tax=uncultured Chryseobacterium sp. TaxID=259322 RepID=UPI0025E7BC2C|nr:AAA family ATPase [uncultured Chryseobacterium sp.]
MQVISVINYKGGVGKTTLTSNLSAELANRGYKVLMIDLDPQTSLTFSFIKPDEWSEHFATDMTIKNWFKTAKRDKIDFNDLIIDLHMFDNEPGQLNLISSHLDLINIDLELATQLSGANMSQAKANFLKVHSILLKGIEQLSEDYNFVIIDCPPNFNIVTKNAIVASDYILIPAKPDYLSTLGIDYLQRSVNQLINDYNDYCKIDDNDEEEDYIEIDPRILGVVFTMVQFYGGVPIQALRQYMTQTKKLGLPIFKDHIRENKTIFSDAPEYGIPVVISDHHRADIVAEIRAFVTDFESKV